MSTPQTSRPAGLQVELPASLDAVYSNLVIIQHSPSEFVLDFARVLPNMPAARVGTRVVMTPMHAKLLLRALQENIERFEAQFGPNLPAPTRRGAGQPALPRRLACEEPQRLRGSESRISPLRRGVRRENLIGLTQLAGREPHIWRVIGQNTPYMAVGMTQLGPNCVTPT